MAAYSQQPIAPYLGSPPVSVGPTTTTIVSQVSCWNFEELSITLTNDDATQQLDAWVEMAPDLNGAPGPWDQSQWTGLEQIAAGESRTEVAVVRGRQWCRVVGRASGAGLSCRVWLLKVTP